MTRHHHHTDYLHQALRLAQRYRGLCSPNPAVGAVLVAGDQIIAQGAHTKAGKPHAEVEALSQLPISQRQGTSLYVTLEPCCHHGKTPPCTDLIIQSGIKTVYYAYADPNPCITGQGHQALTQAGINCYHYPLDEINRFYQSYHHWWQSKQPWVTVKLALSLDGKTAAQNKIPVAITGQALKKITFQHRLHSDAILTTASTILHDNPQLNVRLETNTVNKPLYVIDSQLRTPLDSQILEINPNITIFYDQQISTQPQLQALEQRGVKCIAIGSTQSGLNLSTVLDYIGQQAHDLWVEAGATLCTSLLKEQLVQRLLFYIAPKILGQSAPNPFTLPFDFTSAHNISWQIIDNEAICDIQFDNDHQHC